MSFTGRIFKSCLATLVVVSSLGEPPPAASRGFPQVRPAVVADVDPFLYPAFAGRTSLNAVFDHKTPQNDLRADGELVTYNGYLAKPADGINRKLVDYDVTAEGVPDVAYDQHEGIDFNLDYVPVLAAANSQRVVRAGWDDPSERESGYGLFVRLEHGNGYDTLYAHLSALAVMSCSRDCTSAERGQMIGVSGDTGNSGGPHLHFGVLHTGTNIHVDRYGWDPAENATVQIDPWGGNEQVQPLWVDGHYPDVSLGPWLLPSGDALTLPAPPFGYPPDGENPAVDDYAHETNDNTDYFEASSNCWNRSGDKPLDWAVHGRNLSATVNQGTCSARWHLPTDRRSGTYAAYIHIPQAHACSTDPEVCPDPLSAGNPPLTREAHYTVMASSYLAARPIIDQGLINEWVLRSDTYSSDLNI